MSSSRKLAITLSKCGFKHSHKKEEAELLEQSDTLTYWEEEEFFQHF